MVWFAVSFEVIDLLRSDFICVLAFSDILIQFLRVPDAVMREFRVKCLTHVRRLTEFDSGGEVPLDNPDSQAGSPNLCGSPSTSSRASSSPASPSRSPIARHISSRGLSRSGIDSTASSHSAASVDSLNRARSFNWKHAGLLLLVTLVLAYFTSLYWISFGVFEPALRNAPIEVWLLSPSLFRNCFVHFCFCFVCDLHRSI
jgi:hypothetical protein